MNNELLQSAKDEAARENRFNDWDDVITYNLSFGLSNNRLEALINRAMEIYAEMRNGVYEIDFNGNVLARIQVSANGLVVTGAMNGYGDSIDIDKITIKTTKP